MQKYRFKSINFRKNVYKDGFFEILACFWHEVRAMYGLSHFTSTIALMLHVRFTNS